MMRFTTGDILRADSEALVNTVNCVGVMGRGIALQFKKAFPDNFKAYAAACQRGDVQPGRMFFFETEGLSNPRFIINFPTKRHWRGKSRIEDIASGLDSLATEVRRRHIHSLAIPPLGSGLGGLYWHQVRALIEEKLADLKDVDVLVFEPGEGARDALVNRSTSVPRMTAGRAALVGLMNRYLGGLMDPFVSLLEVHKLMYFMQEAGENLRLRYNKGHYGPYAENLRHVLNDIEGHLITGYSDGGDRPNKQLDLVPGAVNDAEKFLATHEVTHARFDRVAHLVQGFETPYGLELLSTVHWIMQREGAVNDEAILEGTYAWSEHKRRFTPIQIEVATERLRSEGWASGRGDEAGS